MQIHGLNKTTLLDYPGKVAATLFTGGCNFRCPFCHNGDLVLYPESQPLILHDEIFSFLKKRSGILQGVCITGGEPTLQPDLDLFIADIKSLGLPVKLDTNGYRPDILKDLVRKNLLDFVAMDIKNCPENYAKTTGIPHVDTGLIKESAAFLMSGAIPYEFRTTVAKELHTDEDFKKIGIWLKGCRQYFLQSYQETDCVLCPGFHAYDRQKLEAFRSILLPFIPNTSLRGVD